MISAKTESMTVYNIFCVVQNHGLSIFYNVQSHGISNSIMYRVRDYLECTESWAIYIVQTRGLSIFCIVQSYGLSIFYNVWSHGLSIFYKVQSHRLSILYSSGSQPF